MSSKNSKDIRKQIKNVVQEVFPQVFTKEAQDAMVAGISPMVKEMLEGIREQMTKTQDKHNAAALASDSAMLEAAAEQLEDMRITQLAWQLLMAQKLEQAAIVGPEWAKELEDTKKIIRDAKPKSE